MASPNGRHASSPHSPQDAARACEVSERDQLLTSVQVAERWQTSKDTVYRLEREGSLRGVKLGRYTRFRIDAIEAFELAGGGRTE